MTKKTSVGDLWECLFPLTGQCRLKICDLMFYYDSGGRGASSIKAVSQGWGGRVSLWSEARLCGSSPGVAAG